MQYDWLLVGCVVVFYSCAIDNRCKSGADRPIQRRIMCVLPAVTMETYTLPEPQQLHKRHVLCLLLRPLLWELDILAHPTGHSTQHLGQHI